MLSLSPVVLAQLCLQIVRSGQQLILVYVLVQAWGAASFGDWVVLMSAATFVSMSDVGMQTVLSNQCLRFSRDEDRKMLSDHVENVLGFYVLFTPLGCFLLGLLCIPPALPLILPSLQFISGTSRNLVFLSLAASFLISIPLNVLGSVYAASGEVARGIGRVSIQLIVQTLLILLCVNLHGGVLTVALTYPLAALICLIWVLFDLSGRHPDLSMRPRFAGWAWWMKQLRLGVLYFLSPFATLIFQNIPIFFAAFVVARADVVATYAVARTLVGLLRQLSVQLANAVSVEIMRRYVRGEGEKSRELFADANRFLSAMSGLLGGFILAIAPSLFSLWTQNKVGSDPKLMFVLVLTVCFAAPLYQSLALLQVGNKPFLLTVGILTQASLGCALAYGLSFFGDVTLLVLSLSLLELLMTAGIAYKAQKTFSAIDLRSIGGSYAIVLLGIVAAFVITSSMVALSPFSQSSHVNFLIASALASVPILVLFFYLGLSGLTRRQAFERLAKLRSKVRRYHM